MTAENLNQRKLRQAIVDAFDESELRTLCFDLKIDYDLLPAGNKLDKTRGLIALCLREQRLEELISLCEERRPRVNWRGMMATAVSSENPPFMGLKYFTAEDANLFFGRESLTEELTTHLQAHHFLAVVGASGSGKSSLVRAGLVPNAQKAQPNLKIHIFTPTDHPLEALAATLTRHTDSVGVTAKFIDAMADDPRSLHLAARRLVNNDEQLLLIIDQFEELFTLCRSEKERQAFVDNLVTAVSNPNGQPSNRPTRAVIALRADFYHHCAQFDTLRNLLETQQRFIGAMNPAELRRAIEQPAQKNGLIFEDGLVDLLLRDVGASGDQPPDPGTLPLLSHALLETWQRREGNRLTFSGYTDAGGVQGAIAKTAESVFTQKLTPKQQTIARSIFLRLTELGEGTQDTRRRALISELLPTNDAADEAQTVLNLLSSARLVTTDEESAEVTHEALIREWPTLRRWLDENRDGLRLHRHLTESTQAWQQLNRDSGELYRGTRLEQAQAWAAQHDDELNEMEREFLAESVHAVEHRARSERLIQILGISALAIILVGAVVASIVFSWQAKDNRELAETAVAGQETAVAADELALKSTTGAIALRTREVESSATATAIIEQSDDDRDFLSFSEEIRYGTNPINADTDNDGLNDVVELSMGSDPLTQDTDADNLQDSNDIEPLRPIITADLIELINHQLEKVIVIHDENRSEFSIYGLSISGKAIAAVGYEEKFNTATLYGGSFDNLFFPIHTFEIDNQSIAMATGYSNSNNNDPRLFAVIGINFISVSFRDLGGVPFMLTGFGNTLCSAAIHPDDATMLVGGRAKWGYFSGSREITSESQNYNTNACYTDAIFSYDGTYFGLIEDEGQYETIFIGEVLLRSFARPFNKSVSGAIDMALSTDGNILMVGYENGRVELYDYSDRRGGPPLIFALDAHPSFARAVFSPDDSLIATSSPEDDIVRLWRAADGEMLLELDAEADGVTSLIFSQDGHFLLFGTTAGEIHVYGMPEVER